MEHRDQHVAAGDFLAARRLHVQRRALQHPLHADRVARRHFLTLGHPLDLLVQVMRELAPQSVEVGAAILENVLVAVTSCSIANSRCSRQTNS